MVREEMAAIGGQEVHFPALLPREPYEASGRWTAYGNDIFRLKDRRGADYLLGPTHEELFTLLVKDLYASYKDFPVILYQVQTKFRDEARPRAGLLRGREFLMKDAYSFDLSDDGSGRVVPEAPGRVHQDLRPAGPGLHDRGGHVRRDGRLGSEEFLAATPVGEDTFVGLHGLRLRGEHRGGHHARAAARRSERLAGADGARHAGHADDRDPGRPGQRRTSSAAGPTGPPPTR